MYIEDWANNRYDYPLADSIRNGKGQIILRPVLVGQGKLPGCTMDITDASGRPADRYNLNFDEPYRVKPGWMIPGMN